MSDDLGSFFAEISHIEEVIGSGTLENADGVKVSESEVPDTTKSIVVQSQVISKPAEIKSHVERHAVYTYDFADSKTGGNNEPTVDPYAHYTSIPASSSAVSYAATSSATHHYAQPAAPVAPPMAPRQNKTFVRSAAEEVWVDETLNEWPENDYRIFVGDLGKEVTTEHLAKHFQIYKSFAKAKV